MAWTKYVIKAIRATFGDEDTPVEAVPAGTRCNIIKVLPDGYTVLIETDFGYYETSVDNLSD